jgi:DNA-binding NtrC family response regulator
MNREPTSLNVLVMDDSADDTAALLRRLASAGYQLSWQRALTESEYRAALHMKLDVIFADTNLSQLSIRRAIDLLSELKLNIPFVVLSGSVSEECGLAGLIDRASGVILKNRLDLALANVRQVLRHAHTQTELEATKLELQKVQSKLRFRESGRGEAPSFSSKTILLVEDDLSDRRLTGVSLVRRGYTVLPASDVASALNTWAEHAGQIDLLITSAVLPGGASGYDLASQLVGCQPSLKVIVTRKAGGKSTGEPPKLRALRLLEKPFAAAALLRLIRECLEQQD